ncbi:unnamed protein product, partial [Caretta caretta]
MGGILLSHEGDRATLGRGQSQALWTRLQGIVRRLRFGLRLAAGSWEGVSRFVPWLVAVVSPQDEEELDLLGARRLPR